MSRPDGAFQQEKTRPSAGDSPDLPSSLEPNPLLDDVLSYWLKKWRIISWRTEDHSQAHANLKKASPALSASLNASFSDSTSDMNTMLHCKVDQWAEESLSLLSRSKTEGQFELVIRLQLIPFVLSFALLIVKLVQIKSRYNHYDFVLMAELSTILLSAYFAIQSILCLMPPLSKAALIAGLVPISITILELILSGPFSAKFMVAILTIILQSLWLRNVRQLRKKHLTLSGELIVKEIPRLVKKYREERSNREEISVPSRPLHTSPGETYDSLGLLTVQKISKALHRVQSSRKRAQRLNDAQVFERIPYYLTIGILVCYLFQFFFMGLTTVIEYQRQPISFLWPELAAQFFYFFAQLFFSRKQAFPFILVIIAIAVLTSSVVILVHTSLSGLSTLVPAALCGCGFLLVTTILQSLWIYLAFAISERRTARGFFSATSTEEKEAVLASDDDKVSPKMFEDPDLDATLDALLVIKMQKRLHGVEKDPLIPASTETNVWKASLLQRIQFYVSASVPLCYVPTIVYLTLWITFTQDKGGLEALPLVLAVLAAIPISLSGVYFLVQTVRSYQMRITPWVEMAGIISLVCLIGVAGVAMVVIGPYSALGGNDFLIVGIVIQYIWTRLVAANRP